MATINTIQLNSKISIFRDDISQGYDLTGDPIAGEIKIESDAAIFDKSTVTQDNYQQTVEYDTVVYSKLEVQDEDLIHLSTTTSDTSSGIKTYTVQKVVAMKDVMQNTVGWKIWL